MFHSFQVVNRYACSAFGCTGLSGISIVICFIYSDSYKFYIVCKSFNLYAFIEFECIGPFRIYIVCKCDAVLH